MGRHKKGSEVKELLWKLQRQVDDGLDLMLEAEARRFLDCYGDVMDVEKLKEERDTELKEILRLSLPCTNGFRNGKK